MTHTLEVGAKRALTDDAGDAGAAGHRVPMLVIVGTRPEAIKMIPVVRAMRASGKFAPVVISTGQHEQLVATLFHEAGLQIDAILHAAQPRHGATPSLNEMVAGVITGLDRIWRDQEIPEEFRAGGTGDPRGAVACLVHGDTSSAAAAALAAFNLQIPVVHIEAGLRTGNLTEPFPEEANRQLISRLAAVHFAPTETNRANLVREGIDAGRIVVTGNTSVDMLRSTVAAAGDFGPGLRELCADGSRRIVLVTAHRRENWGSGLSNIAAAVSRLAANYSDTAFVVPMHPNPVAREPFKNNAGDQRNVFLVEPRDYAAFMHLVARATLIITDSGGVQEEAPALGIPVLVTRGVTERSEGVAAGTLELVGTDPDTIVSAATRILERSDTELQRRRAEAPANPYGDGHASERIVHALSQVWGEDAAQVADAVNETLRQAVSRFLGDPMRAPQAGANR